MYLLQQQKKRQINVRIQFHYVEDINIAKQ